MSFAKQAFESQFEYGEAIEAGGASVPQGIAPVPAERESDPDEELCIEECLT